MKGIINLNEMIIASVTPEKYNFFDVRGTKPIFHKSPTKVSPGAVVESLAELKMDNNRNKVKHILPNPIGIQLNIVDSSIDKIKELNTFHRINQNQDILKNKIYHDSKLMYDYIEQVQIAIVFGYTALETFTNLSIPNNYEYKIQTNRGTSEIYDKNSIERWLSLKEKISEIIVDVYQTRDIKKDSIWQKFDTFEKYRHEIIHQKSVTSFSYYKKYFNEKTIKNLEVPKNMITWFYKEVESNGKTNPIWPWVSSDTNSIPVIYDADNFFNSSKVIGNLYEGIKRNN